MFIKRGVWFKPSKHPFTSLSRVPITKISSLLSLSKSVGEEGGRGFRRGGRLPATTPPRWSSKLNFFFKKTFTSNCSSSSPLLRSQLIFQRTLKDLTRSKV